MMPEPTLAFLQTLIERVIEGQHHLLDRMERLEKRQERVERALLAGQRLLIDRTEAEAGIQHQLDDVIRRVMALEAAATR
jgi:hypothetical protein